MWAAMENFIWLVFVFMRKELELFEWPSIKDSVLHLVLPSQVLHNHVHCTINVTPLLCEVLRLNPSWVHYHCECVCFIKGRFRDLTVMDALYFIKSYIFTFLHLYCMCELKSERDLESMPPSIEIQIVIDFRCLTKKNHFFQTDHHFLKATCVSQTAWFILHIDQVLLCLPLSIKNNLDSVSKIDLDPV